MTFSAFRDVIRAGALIKKDALPTKSRLTDGQAVTEVDGDVKSGFRVVRVAC